METKASLSRIVVIITALFAALSGIYLLVGGIWLAKLGGSLYYIIAGVISLVTAWLLYRRRSSALLLYAIFLFGTTVWAVWEVGTDFWALTPRLDVTFFLGLWSCCRLCITRCWRKMLSHAALWPFPCCSP